MDKILQNLYLKLDNNSQSLMQKAASQIVIKIIYSGKESGITRDNIIDEFKKVAKTKRIDESLIDSVIEQLINDNEILSRKKLYYLSTNKRNRIDNAVREYEERKNSIIEQFFSPTHSDKKIVEDWLVGAMISFFQYFSNEWISNLTGTQKALINAQESIKKIINNKTKSNKNLNARDKEILPNKLFELLTTKDPRIEQFIWDFGTSAFSARLINSSLGTDNNILSRFRETTCILDTNILISLALNDKRYRKSFEAIESAFQSLGIKIVYYSLTEDEYIRAVELKKDEVLRNTCFPITVLQETDDEYVEAACALHCSSRNDFELFFNQISQPPQSLIDKLPISKYSEDRDLRDCVKEAINNESLCSEFDDLYVSYHRRNKSLNTLRHDVALIEATYYLQCKGERVFVLSQDSVVNHFAKRHPLIELPISISLETLINVLAVENDCRDNSDYAELFASIIRNGLSPQHGTFKLEDLTYMQEQNQQISSLPPEMTIQLAMKVNEMRLLGEPKEKIALELMHGFQSDRLKVADDLRQVQNDLALEKAETKRHKETIEKQSRKLIENAQKSAEKGYKLAWLKFGGLCVVILFVIALILCIVNRYKIFGLDTDSLLYQIIFALVIDIVSSALLFFKTGFVALINHTVWIENAVKQELEYDKV